MAETIPVCIPRETVNDDEVLIQQWRVSNGELVSEGQTLAEVETSKSVVEIASPATGIVELKVPSGREAAVGDILCLIHPQALAATVRMPSKDAPTNAQQSQAWSPESADSFVQRTRFSRLALDRLQELGRVPSDFEGRGLVRVKDIESSLMVNDVAPTHSVATDTADRNGKSTSTQIPDMSEASSWKSMHGVDFDTSPLSRSKKLERKLLSWSSRQAIRSTVSVFVPTLGQDVLQVVAPDISQIVAAKIISVTAKLLREFPALNACCLEDDVRHYREVHIGFAVDAGHGLKVAVIRSADQMSPEQIREARELLIAAYLENALRPEQLNGATFTISDLSGSGVTTFDPLISEGQSAILGIGSEIGESHDRNGYHLILSFDHRLAEGRLAAMFLNRIRQEMILFEQGLLDDAANSSHCLEPKCCRCGMTSATAAQRQHYLTETVAANWSRRFVCTICLQGR